MLKLIALVFWTPVYVPGPLLSLTCREGFLLVGFLSSSPTVQIQLYSNSVILNVKKQILARLNNPQVMKLVFLLFFSVSTNVHHDISTSKANAMSAKAAVCRTPHLASTGGAFDRGASHSN